MFFPWDIPRLNFVPKEDKQPQRVFSVTCTAWRAVFMRETEMQFPLVLGLCARRRVACSGVPPPPFPSSGPSPGHGIARELWIESTPSSSALQHNFLSSSCKHQVFQLTFPWMSWLSSALACAWGQCLVLCNLRGRAASSAGAGLVLLPVQGLTFSSSMPGGNAAGGASFGGKKDPARYCAG